MEKLADIWVYGFDSERMKLPAAAYCAEAATSATKAGGCQAAGYSAKENNRASLAIDFASVPDLHHVDTSGDVINAVANAIVALSNAKAFGFA